MKPATFGALVSATLYEKRFGPYFVSPVIAGLDAGAGDAPYLCGMDSIGAIETAHDFMVAGTAPDSLYGMCESMWRPDMVRMRGRGAGRGARGAGRGGREGRVGGVPGERDKGVFFSPCAEPPSSPFPLHTHTTGPRRPVRDRLPVLALRHRPGRPGRVGGCRVCDHARRVHRPHAQGADGLREKKGGVGRRGVQGGHRVRDQMCVTRVWGVAVRSFFFFCGGGRTGEEREGRARGEREGGPTSDR